METLDKSRQHELLRLYTLAFPAVAQHVARQGGTLDDAKDIFQEAMVILYEKHTAGNLKIEHSNKAYLLGIARHLWYHERTRQQGRVTDDILNHAQIANDENATPAAERLLRVLETAGKKCMDLLQAFYYDKLSMKQIAEHFGLSGERSATVQKHKCMEKVRETVKQKSMVYEDFCN